MKKSLLLFLALMSSYVHSKNNYEYKTKIQNFYDKKSLCIGPIKWPVSIVIGGDAWINAQMESFVEENLAKFRLEYGKKIWELSDKGKKAFTNKKGFCYGRLKITSVERTHSNENGVIIFTFKYTIDNLPGWAKQKSIRLANTDLDNLISGASNARYQVLFKKDNNGKITILTEPEQINLYY